MKAAIINKYGAAEEFQISDIEDLTYKPHQILIQVYASSINPVDWKIRKGLFRFITGKKFPKIIGADFSGKVVTSFESDFKAGDEVFGMVNPTEKI